MDKHIPTTVDTDCSYSFHYKYCAELVNVIRPLWKDDKSWSTNFISGLETWLLLWVPPKATKHCAVSKGCRNVPHIMLKGQHATKAQCRLYHRRGPHRQGAPDQLPFFTMLY